MDNNQKKGIKNKIISFFEKIKNFIDVKKLWKVIVPVAAVLAVAALITVGVAILNNYVTFPRIDKALAKSLEAKFDVGTRFDITDLLKKGKAEFAADDVRHIGMGRVDLDVSLSYNGKNAQGSLDFADRRLDAVITKDGIAASSADIEDQGRYGAYFKDVTSALDSSFLNPKNKAENALSSSEYKELLSFAQNLENTANNDGSDKKDAIIILSEVEKVFEDSSLSNKEISYGGIFVNGEKRSARTVTFEFGKADVIDFLEKLEALFDSPSDKLSGAMERLLANDSLTKDIENMGYSLDTCEDLAKFIGDVAELVGRIDEAKAKIEIAYVTDAVSAIIFECEIEKTTDIELLIDFGERPKKDKTLYASLLVAQEHSSSQSERRYTLEYSVERAKKVNVVSAVYSISTLIEDDYGEEIDNSSRSFEITFDTKKDTANFEFERAQSYAVDQEETLLEKSSYNVSCAMDDRPSKLAFTLLGLTVDGDKIYEPTGSITLTLYKKPDSIELGDFTELLKMGVEDADKLASSAVSNIKSIRSSLEHIKLFELKTPTGDEIESDIYFDGFFNYKYDQYYYDQIYFSGSTYERWRYDGKTNEIEKGTYFVSGETITFIPEEKEQYEQNITSAEENSFVIEGNLYEKT